METGRQRSRERYTEEHRPERTRGAVEGVMADRRISKRLRSKVMSTCVTPECLYGTETLALTERQTTTTIKG